MRSPASPPSQHCRRSLRRVGLFGHSQGGWVVIEQRPGQLTSPLSWRPRVSWSVSGRAGALGDARLYAESLDTESEIAEVDRYFDHLLSLMRERVPFEQVRAQVAEEGFPAAFEALHLPFLPENAAIWGFMAAMVDYDPRPALERIAVPVLALFGADDPITPVAESVAVYREAVPGELLAVEVFAGADHRVLSGDPPALAPGYLDTLTSFIHGVVTG